jgi:hypothetical protein
MPFHQQNAKLTTHVVPKMSPRPTRFEFFQDHASLPYRAASEVYGIQSLALGLTLVIPPSRSEDWEMALMDLISREKSPSWSPKKLFVDKSVS